MEHPSARTLRERVLVGVDAYSKGWVAAVQKGSDFGVETFNSFASLAKAFEATAIIAIDIPIGLPEEIVGRGRMAEQAVYPLVHKRRQSVFPMPARAVVELCGQRTRGLSQILAAHQVASTLARARSSPPRGLSIQSFSILPKVWDVDTELRADPALAERVFESHPEIALTVLNNGVEMQHGKKTAAGQRERKDLLIRSGFPEPLVETRITAIPEDDRIDALVMLSVAGRIADERAQSYPERPDRDAYGLPIAIWA